MVRVRKVKPKHIIQQNCFKGIKLFSNKLNQLRLICTVYVYCCNALVLQCLPLQVLFNAKNIGKITFIKSLFFFTQRYAFTLFQSSGSCQRIFKLTLKHCIQFMELENPTLFTTCPFMHSSNSLKRASSDLSFNSLDLCQSQK